MNTPSVVISIMILLSGLAILAAIAIKAKSIIDYMTDWLVISVTYHGSQEEAVEIAPIPRANFTIDFVIKLLELHLESPINHKVFISIYSSEIMLQYMEKQQEIIVKLPKKQYQEIKASIDSTDPESCFA